LWRGGGVSLTRQTQSTPVQTPLNTTFVTYILLNINYNIRLVQFHVQYSAQIHRWS